MASTAPETVPSTPHPPVDTPHSDTTGLYSFKSVCLLQMKHITHMVWYTCNTNSCMMTLKWMSTLSTVRPPIGLRISASSYYKIWWWDYCQGGSMGMRLEPGGSLGMRLYTSRSAEPEYDITMSGNKHCTAQWETLLKYMKFAGMFKSHFWQPWGQQKLPNMAIFWIPIANRCSWSSHNCHFWQ